MARKSLWRSALAGALGILLASCASVNGADVEERLTRLEAARQKEEDLRAIEQLRFRYWYALLAKDIDDFAACFTEDASLDYGYDIELEGVEAIREFFAKLLEDETLIRQIPRGANPRIVLASETEASGRWLADVLILRNREDAGTRVTLQYDETYRKTDSGWRISHIENEYLGFERVTPRDDPF